MTARVVGALRELVGAEAVEEVSGVDAGPSAGGRAVAVVSPAAPDDAAQVMAMACNEGWRIEPIGHGTWTDGARNGVGEEPLVLVSTRRMTRILEYEPGDLTITVQAGATLQDLQRWAGEHSQWLPMDPPPDDRGTVGAMLATGARGPLSHVFGGPRDLTLGLGLATGDGRLLDLGGKVVKNVAGFDLVRVTVGSWGTLGLITSATLRLFPRPEVDVGLVTQGAEEEMDDAARAVVGLPVEPAGIQVHTGVERCALCVRVMGSADEVDHVSELIRAEVRGPWERLEGAAAAPTLDRMRALEEGRALALRVSMLPSRVREARRLLGAFASTAAGLDLGSAETVYEAGTGQFRAGFVTDRGWEDRPSECQVALAELGQAVAQAGGSMRLVHGPPGVRDGHVAWPSDGATTDLVSGILGVFDPVGVLPGYRFGS